MLFLLIFYLCTYVQQGHYGGSKIDALFGASTGGRLHTYSTPLCSDTWAYTVGSSNANPYPNPQGRNYLHAPTLACRSSHEDLSQLIKDFWDIDQPPVGWWHNPCLYCTLFVMSTIMCELVFVTVCIEQRTDTKFTHVTLRQDGRYLVYFVQS